LVLVEKLFVEPQYRRSGAGITFGIMEAHPSPKPTGADPDPQNDRNMMDAVQKAAAREEEMGHWEEDPSDGGDSDPEHSRRLAAIRTELLRRSQPQRQLPDSDEST